MSMNQSAALAALAIGDGVELATEPGNWTSVNTPGAAAQATTAKAAGAAGVRHVCKGISVSIAAGATAQTPIRVVLRDGLTGVGAVLWSKKLSAPVNGVATIDIMGMCIVGSEATAMTLEFVAAGVAASEQDVTLMGLDLSQR